MTTYNISIHKTCSSYCGLDAFGSKHIQLANREDLDRANALCRNRKNMASFWKASVMPIRTNKEFLAQDLFLPTLINGVIKTENATSVALLLIAAFWDAVTLPLRFLTVLPRILFNDYIMTPSNHPLMTYLECKGLNPIHFLGDINVRVYKEEHRDNKIIEQGMCYKLHLTQEEASGIGSNEWSFASSRLQ